MQIDDMKFLTDAAFAKSFEKQERLKVLFSVHVPLLLILLTFIGSVPFKGHHTEYYCAALYALVIVFSTFASVKMAKAHVDQFATLYTYMKFIDRREKDLTEATKAFAIKLTDDSFRESLSVIGKGVSALIEQAEKPVFTTFFEIDREFDGFLVIKRKSTPAEDIVASLRKQRRL